jgi:hypothetical protein
MVRLEVLWTIRSRLFVQNEGALMGRRMRPLDPTAGPVERFAGELRALRTLKGDLPFWKMARRCTVSKSALAAAVAGRSLPSETVTHEFVRVCGGDWPWWHERWMLAAAEAAADRTPRAAGGVLAIPQEKALRIPDSKDVVPFSASGDLEEDRRRVWTAGDDRGRRLKRSRRLRWGTLISSAVIVLLIMGIGYLPSAQHSSAAQRTPQMSAPSQAVGKVRTITENTDPQDTGCDQGTVDTIAIAHVYGPDRFFIGYIWLRYAPACQAVWARFQPATTDMAELPGATVTIEALRPSDNVALTYKTPYLGAFVYGNMLLTTHGCILAEATITAPHPTHGPTAELPPGPITAHAQTSCTLPTTGAQP